MTAAPDFVEAVVGYRAWGLRHDRLHPVTYSSSPWSVGENRAACALRQRSPGHRAPDLACSCGLYGLFEHSDPRLRGGGLVLGAIAAWGEIAVHRTGFRAELARVTALAEPTGAQRTGWEALRRAAAVYGVPLVPLEALHGEALRHGAPLPHSALPAPPPPRRRSPPPAPAGLGWLARAPLYRMPTDVHHWIERHVWAHQAGGLATIGVAAPMRAVLSYSPEIEREPVGARAERGEPIAQITGREGRLVVVAAPVSGTIVEANPLMEVAPHVLVTQPYRRGWIARVKPEDWERDTSALAIGAAGVAHYRNFVSSRGRADAFAHVEAEPGPRQPG